MIEFRLISGEYLIEELMKTFYWYDPETFHIGFWSGDTHMPNFQSLERIGYLIRVFEAISFRESRIHYIEQVVLHVNDNGPIDIDKSSRYIAYIIQSASPEAATLARMTLQNNYELEGPVVAVTAYKE